MTPNLTSVLDAFDGEVVSQWMEQRPQPQMNNFRPVEPVIYAVASVPSEVFGQFCAAVHAVGCAARGYALPLQFAIPGRSGVMVECDLRLFR